MKPFYKNLKFIAVGILTFLGVCSTFVTAQTSISSIGTAFTQDFNTLTTAGSWTNNLNLAGYYALGNGSIPGSFILYDGSTTILNLLSSFGTIGQNDRSLGFVPGGGYGTISYIGWRLKNNTPSTTINSISISWALEQWRRVNTTSQALTIYYQVSPSEITSIVPGNLINSGNSLSSPQFSGSNLVLDGNLSENRVTAIHTINNLNIAPGSEILICWGNAKSVANHLMGIDDISIVAKADQTINFDAIPARTFGDANFNLNATATSGLPITYSSDNSNVATISGNLLTIRGPGTATITASQTGNANYNAAPIQTQVFSASPATPSVKEATSISQTGFTANWDANNGLRDASTTYVIEYSTDKTFDIYYDFFEPIVKTQAIPDLTPNTIYFYRVYSLNDALYSQYSASSAITTGSDYITINSGSWDTGANWDVGYINNIANSITVRHPITLNAYRDSVITNKLVIKSGGKLSSNQKIHVTNELVLEVDSNGVAGQILNTNNVIIGQNAKITVRKSFALNKWSFIGFPFTVSSSNVFSAVNGSSLTWGDLNSGLNYIVQYYNGAERASDGTAEYEGAGLHWDNVPAKEFTANKGYIVYNNTSDSIDFTTRGSNIGSFFSTAGATVATGRYASSAEHAHWNLVVSPLSSEYNLGSTSPGTAYYAYNGINYLPALSGEQLDVQPFSAFFLQAQSTSISFGNVGRRVVAATKKDEVQVDDVYLILSNGNAKYDDFTRIRLQEGATSSYEIGTDAAKMFGMSPKVSYIYTAINKTSVAINTLPRTVTEVDLKTKFAAAGNYTISISNIEKIQNYAAIILIDKETGKRVDLLSVDSYAYKVASAGTSNRFKVQFAPKITTGVSLSDDQSIRITSQQGNASLSGLRVASQVRVYNTIGKIVFSGLVFNNEPIHFENMGLYIFEIATPEKTEIIKSFVR